MPQIKKRLGDRLSEKYLPSIVKEGVDPKLVQDAFDKRFEEVKLSRMREFLPGLLPEQDRADFRDPDWDKRDDPVPAWVTIVHVGFMAWTIVNAHYPALFIPGLLFFLGFAQVTAPFQNRIDLKPALAGRIFPGRAGNSRRCSRLVDCTGSRQSGGNTADAGCNHFNGF